MMDGKPYSFEGREFLVALHDEAAEQTAVRKANQVGATEVFTNVACCDVDAGLPTMFVLPTERVRDRHVTARFNAVVRGSPYIRAMFDETDNVRVKLSGETALYFEGSNSKAGAHSVPIASLVIDEVDRCVQSALPEFEKRLTGQSHYRVRAVSTPTFPGRGVDARFERSRQAFWMVRCPHCEHVGTLDWDERQPTGFPDVAAIVRWIGHPEVSFGTPDAREQASRSAWVECARCGGRWSDEERHAIVSAGEWVPLYPDREVAGYHLPQILSPVRTTIQMVRDQLDSKADEESGERPGAYRTWMNGVRGMPYLSAAEQLERREVEALVGDWKMPNDAVLCAGVDVGTWKHVALGCKVGSKLLVEYHQLKTFDEVIALLLERGVQSVVFDAFPEKEAVEKICEQMGGVAFRAYAPSDQLVPVTWDEPNQIVRISRVSMISTVMVRVRGSTLAIKRGPWSDKVCDHIPRVTVVDAMATNGDPVRRVIKLSTEDHFMWATAYLETASRRVSDGDGKLEFVTDEQFGRDGVTEFVAMPGIVDRMTGVRDLGDESALVGMDGPGGWDAW